MALRKPLRHLVILLPGIMGSVLKHRDGKDVWALSGQALVNFLRSKGTLLRQLYIEQDDPEADDLGDGIYADRLITDIYNIPGLIDGAGYKTIRNRILEALAGQIVEGSIHQPSENANFYPFPYDWRRDNRATARQLGQFVEKQLPRWRKKSGATDAQVIFLAHSMGGLVARYYLEELGGWKYCRTLITFGTPHRGSLKALDFLSNGFRISGGGLKRVLINIVDWKYPELFNDLTMLVRSFRSVYQLLPTYQVLLVGNDHKRVVETENIPNIEPSRALSARNEFHEAIRLAVENNAKDKRYRNKTQPIVGINRETYQSAFFHNGLIELSYHPPTALDPDKVDGDGTVPRVSAVPVDLDEDDREQYLAEHHGWLTNELSFLQVLPTRLRNLAAKSSKALLGASDKRTVSPLSLSLDPLYLAGETIAIKVTLDRDRAASHELILHIDPVDASVQLPPRPIQLTTQAEETVQLEPLPAGLYSVRLDGVDAFGKPTAAHSVFEVVE
jgi:pimeloyl-ACP methyl ester carboxylesterase